MVEEFEIKEEVEGGEMPDNEDWTESMKNISDGEGEEYMDEELLMVEGRLSEEERNERWKMYLKYVDALILENLTQAALTRQIKYSQIPQLTSFPSTLLIPNIMLTMIHKWKTKIFPEFVTLW